MATTEITWRDVQQMPDDGRRREAVEGELYVTGAPAARSSATSTWRRPSEAMSDSEREGFALDSAEQLRAFLEACDDRESAPEPETP
jgi:hypothetical protein